MAVLDHAEGRRDVGELLRNALPIFLRSPLRNAAASGSPVCSAMSRSGANGSGTVRSSHAPPRHTQLAARLLDEPAHERRLAHSGLTRHDHYPACPLGRARNRFTEPTQRLLALEQRRASPHALDSTPAPTALLAMLGALVLLVRIDRRASAQGCPAVNPRR
jgi:hypothetical protein